MQAAELSEAILRLVASPGYRPIKPRSIAQRLGLPKTEGDHVKAAVKKLVAAGKLAYGAGHLVRSPDAPKAAGNRLVGTFRRNEAGFGFVRPKGTPPRPRRRCLHSRQADEGRRDRRRGGRSPARRRRQAARAAGRNR